MPGEVKPNPPLPHDQEVMAYDLLEACELEDVADVMLTVNGVYGNVLHGLGRCAHEFERYNLTVDQIAQSMRTKIKEQYES